MTDIKKNIAPAAPEITHTVIFTVDGLKCTAYKTQEDLAKLLQDPRIKLISVNDQGSSRSTYTRRKRRVNPNAQKTR